MRIIDEKESQDRKDAPQKNKGMENMPQKRVEIGIVTKAAGSILNKENKNTMMNLVLISKKTEQAS